ncbi:MAG: uL30 family ribosomal protein [Nanoarchaeota archaeon]|nr:uL30 family ribosomal protein [Nanoarchaeota archaeon]
MPIAVIRIKGQVGLKKPIVETLNRLRLRRKYACVVFAKPNKIQEGMIKKVKDFIAFGEINKETFEKLIEARGRLINKKKSIDVKKTIEELEKGKKYEDVNLKPFFRLHPPRGGIDSKKHFGVQKGVLGNHKDKINKLIERML